MEKKIFGMLIIVTLLISTAIIQGISNKKENNIIEIDNLNKIDIKFDTSHYELSNDIKIPIDQSNIDGITFSKNPFNIYEGIQWKLHVTAYWDPPQPETQICLWADIETLPYGSIFPECQCDYGSVTSTLEWKPSTGQSGTYQIYFYVGENCYNPIGYFIITVIVHPLDLEPQETFDIYVGQNWHLEVTTYWSPPQPERPICLWVDPESLPYGATFTECHCDYSQVSSDLYWTPTFDQIGEHLITFLVGETCGYYEYPYPILCNVLASECHDEPILSDNSGQTTFHAVIVGVDHDNDNDDSTTIESAEYCAEKVKEALLKHEGWDEANVSLLKGSDADYDDIKNAIDDAKERARPGDEFLFYFANHGDRFDDTNNDETDGDGKDGSIWANDFSIKDDDLKDWLSGFPYCVTITVKIDCCFSGEFEDDLKQAKNGNETPQPYGDHINIETSIDKDHMASRDDKFYWNDSNNDGKVDVERGELEGPCGYPLDHPDKIWYDKNGDGRVQNDEIIDPDDEHIITFFNWTRANLEALGPAENSFLKNYNGYTNADRNQDGITTTKEVFEYSIDFQHKTLGIDNDKDGLINEDGADLQRVNGATIRLFIDNDGDGLIDEDPGPGNPQFWYNDKPRKPSSISGPTEGKIGETYIYSTSTTDQDGDDIYYWFDFGDGTNSGWIGPLASGTLISVQKSWNQQGSYTIKVKARDRCYFQSDWTYLNVNMPKSRDINPLFQWIIDYHLSMFPLLKHLFNL